MSGRHESWEEGRHYGEAGDSKELIEICLNCRKAECNDCISRGVTPDYKCTLTEIPPFSEKIAGVQHPERAKRRYEMYIRGFNDAEIGKALEEHPSVVSCWRRRSGLKALSKVEQEFRKAMYKYGDLE